MSDQTREEIFVVFGKRLINGSVTVEYKSRIDYLIQTLKERGYLDKNSFLQLPNNSKIIFTGGQKELGENYTEAGLGREYFQTKIKALDKVIVLDREAKNTAENINNLLQSIDPKSSFLKLITSDYQLMRLINIEELFQKNKELLSKIEESGAKYRCLPVPYIYRGHKCPIKRWMAELYLEAENFKIMSSGLVSIVKNGEDILNWKKILPENVIDYFINYYYSFIDKLVVTSNSNKNNPKFHEIIDKTHPPLKELLNTYFIIKEISDKNYNPKSNEWKEISNLWNKYVSKINKETDPDEPINNLMSPKETNLTNLLTPINLDTLLSQYLFTKVLGR